MKHVAVRHGSSVREKVFRESESKGVHLARQMLDTREDSREDSRDLREDSRAGRT